MKRIRCKMCRARPRKQFALEVAELQVCNKCWREYSNIFYGRAATSAQDARDMYFKRLLKLMDNNEQSK